jgi:multicomponent Na+:H+ antiporter subunit G
VHGTRFTLQVENNELEQVHVTEGLVELRLPGPTGTVGMLRFPDVYSRLHALTKADNVGLLCICAAMALFDGSPRVAALLAMVWLLALLAATVSAHLIARHARAADRDG